ncbi:hypothetical protein D3C86_1713750 [compost metagenome]
MGVGEVAPKARNQFAVFKYDFPIPLIEMLVPVRHGQCVQFSCEDLKLVGEPFRLNEPRKVALVAMLDLTVLFQLNNLRVQGLNSLKHTHLVVEHHVQLFIQRRKSKSVCTGLPTNYAGIGQDRHRELRIYRSVCLFWSKKQRKYKPRPRDEG